MNTEDETFRILSRPSAIEMLDIQNHWIKNHSDFRNWDKVLIDNNWTENEWKNFWAASGKAGNGVKA